MPGHPEQQDTPPTTLADIFAPIAPQLADVEHVLESELATGHGPIDELVSYLMRPGGKRLRPALVLLSAQAGGRLRARHVRLAAIVEMIHLAALVHDDVLDGASLRRHRPTVRVRWSNETAVLLGDYVFTQAFRLVNRLNSRLAHRLVASAVGRICQGELHQTLRRGDLGISERDYVAMISAKTAELCRLSCRLGAEFSQATRPHVRCLAAYGRALGVAFQMTDDLLDITGSERQMGKTLGTDLHRQRVTLPLIRLVAQATESDLRTIRARLGRDGGPDLRWLRARLREDGCLAYTQAHAERYAAKARQHLTDLPDSEARNRLEQLAGFVVRRAV